MRLGSIANPCIQPNGEGGKGAGQFVNAFGIAAAPLYAVKICYINGLKGMDPQKPCSHIEWRTCSCKRRYKRRIGRSQAQMRTHHGPALQIDHWNNFERLTAHKLQSLSRNSLIL